MIAKPRCPRETCILREFLGLQSWGSTGPRSIRSGPASPRASARTAMAKRRRCGRDRPSYCNQPNRLPQLPWHSHLHWESAALRMQRSRVRLPSAPLSSRPSMLGDGCLFSCARVTRLVSIDNLRRGKTIPVPPLGSREKQRAP